ncbi:S-4TM family putative pore-forming effector [Ornithobacterium rhinotracheale]|uniref:S-4TM family putative pore-forming effector n=1 Tax=Ornithobacterium rhinotracheale TaxID=28251 RepID=UPI003FA42BD6
MNKGQKILSKQNIDINIDRLLAQRRLYSNAKIMQHIIITISVIVPVIIAFFTNIFTLKIDNTNSIYIIYTIIAILVEKILEVCINRNKKRAASIQEKFDTSIFEIPENEFLDSAFIDNEIIRKYSKKDKSNKKIISKVTDWYSKEIGYLQTNISVLFCQRMNICYDQNIKKKYDTLLISISLLTFMVLLVFSLINDFSLKKFIAEVILPSIPIVNFTYTEINRNMKSVDSLQKLREIIEGKLSSLSRNDTIKIETLRNIQDQIFNNRILSPLIPDFIYNFFWTDLEDEMNYSVENRIKELK